MRALPMRVLAAFLWLAVDAHASAELAKAKNCVSCHKLSGQLVGPAYQSIAAKYAGDPEGLTKLSTSIRAGGVGRWGNIAMPPQPQVSDAEARQLAQWILSLKR